MQQQTFRVHFILKLDKLNKDGLAPIYARIRMNGIKVEISTTRFIDPKNWLLDSQTAFPLTKNNKALNQYLDSFKNKIYTGYTSMLSTGESINGELLRQSIFGKPLQKKYNLIETTIEHNEQFEKQIGIKYSQGSYKNYKTTLKYLIEFVKSFFSKTDIPLDKMDYKFCENYFSFLTTKKQCNTNGANKQLQRVKKIVNYAIKLGYINSNPIASYSLQFKPARKIPLSMEEIDRLVKLNLERKTLSQVRDIFIFQCYTGLSYSDIKRLRSSDIEKDGKGVLWIKMERQKTEIEFSVPLLKPATKLVESYLKTNEGDFYLFPVLSNQKMNDNLKVIQEIAGLSKNLTTHIGRHTFATTVTLNNDVPIETVSKMLGHTNLRTTQLYAKVLDGKIGSDMLRLSNKLD